jgi:hypothetical protein
MFNRIPVDIINVPLVIQFIANQVLPVAALPKTTLASFDTACGPFFTRWNLPRKPRLDKRPAGFVIDIPVWQRPDTMQVLRENHHGIDGKRVIVFHFAKDLTKQVDMLRQKGVFLALITVDREKITRSGHRYSAVVCHRYRPVIMDTPGIYQPFALIKTMRFVPHRILRNYESHIIGGCW